LGNRAFEKRRRYKKASKILDIVAWLTKGMLSRNLPHGLLRRRIATPWVLTGAYVPLRPVSGMNPENQNDGPHQRFKQ
jgi:hypothetical protein